MSGVFSPLNKHFIEPLFTLTTAERVLFIASKKKKKTAPVFPFIISVKPSLARLDTKCLLRAHAWRTGIPSWEPPISVCSIYSLCCFPPFLTGSVGVCSVQTADSTTIHNVVENTSAHSSIIASSNHFTQYVNSGCMNGLNHGIAVYVHICKPWPAGATSTQIHLSL